MRKLFYLIPLLLCASAWGQVVASGKVSVSGGVTFSATAASCTLPTNCGTVESWYDGASLYCTSALCSSAGTSATAINDLSGNGNTVTLNNNATDCQYEPTLYNGQPGMVLAGNCQSSSILHAPLAWSTSATFIFVGSTADALDEQGIIAGTTNPQPTYRINSSTQPDFVIPASADIVHGATLTVNTVYDLSASYNSSTGAGSLTNNGSADGSATNAHAITNGITTLFYEPNSSCCVFAGHFLEIIIFIPALTSTQLSNLHANYLVPKYGI